MFNKCTTFEKLAKMVRKATTKLDVTEQFSGKFGQSIKIFKTTENYLVLF